MPDGDDYLIFRPDQVDLTRSPLRRGVDEPTHVLGAFNPGFARLPNGNLLLMVRVAEIADQVRLMRQRSAPLGHIMYNGTTTLSPWSVSWTFDGDQKVRRVVGGHSEGLLEALRRRLEVGADLGDIVGRELKQASQLGDDPIRISAPPSSRRFSWNTFWNAPRDFAGRSFPLKAPSMKGWPATGRVPRR